MIEMTWHWRCHLVLRLHLMEPKIKPSLATFYSFIVTMFIACKNRKRGYIGLWVEALVPDKESLMCLDWQV